MSIDDKLESSMEQSEFIRDMTSNLLLTMSGISVIADKLPFQITVIIILILINIVFLFFRLRKKKSTDF
ncbi:MAG: hypothetical protein KGD63_14295 [Candidatus Lokiarchaeota archaeon]|nr:hypothetical protein [Candidatus Lokiarchaeota archaeon]